MKKFFVTVFAALAAVLAGAQDINSATDYYNNAVSYYSAGDLVSALAQFQQAYDIAKQCGEQGQDIVADCETNIPILSIQIAKEAAKAGDYDLAVAKLQDAVGICKSVGADDKAAEAQRLIPQFYLQQGNTALKSKDYELAVSAFAKVLEIDPANGKAAVYQGQAYEKLGNNDAAEKSYLLAMENGQAKAAGKQLSKIYLKKASASNKAKDFATAVSQAKKSIEYNPENEQAYYIAGLASQNLKDNANAIVYFEKYLELAPSSANSQAVREVVAALKKAK
ncbi:MAG: tetratricopeptide repeat protein [Candidatus Cryptobacteroides sp.]